MLLFEYLFIFIFNLFNYLICLNINLFNIYVRSYGIVDKTVSIGWWVLLWVFLFIPHPASGSFSAEALVRSSQTYLFSLSIKKYFLDQSVENTFYLILKTEALQPALLFSKSYNVSFGYFHPEKILLDNEN